MSNPIQQQIVSRGAAKSWVRPIFLRAELTVMVATLIILSSLHVTWSGWGVDLAMQSAAAKDGNGKGSGGGGGNGNSGEGNGGGNGNSGGKGKGKDTGGGGGNGGGNGKGSDNGGGNGNGGGKGKGSDKGGGNGDGGNNGKGGDNGGGGGNGNSGGKNTGNGGTNTSDDEDTASDSGQRDVRSVNPATGAQVTIRGKSIEVLHRNGMSESVKAGRYLMRDDKGRTIVERSATKADVRRLRNLKG